MYKFILWFVILLTARSGSVAAQQLAKPRHIAQLDARIMESSGLAISKQLDRFILWTHADSGGPAALYAVNLEGELLGVVHLENTVNIDWEELTIDSSGHFIVGDIGNNNLKRETLRLLRFLVPQDLEQPVRADAIETITFRYPGEKHDAEALVVWGEFAFVFTKELGRTRCYRISLKQRTEIAPVHAECIADVRGIGPITGAALSTDGQCLALLQYSGVLTFELPQTLDCFPVLSDAHEDKATLFSGRRRGVMQWMGQCEAIAWHGSDLLITNEGGAIFRIENARERTEKEPAP